MAEYRIPGPALDLARKLARRVRELESEAQQALNGSGDVAGHRACLVEKCRQIAALPDVVGGFLPQPRTDGMTIFMAGLENFTERAELALTLESIFFMRALLYPEDYREGDPNDFERFLDQFASA